MVFEEIVHIAGYFALVVLALLVLANVMIIWAQLFHNWRVAQNISDRLVPIAAMFRLGSTPKDRMDRRRP